MPKTEFLQIRCTPEDRERIQRVAEAEHLDMSTWARRVLLQSVEHWETRRTPQLKVAERPAVPFSAQKGRDRKR